MPLQVLTVHLLHEVSKGPQSFWHPYLSQLPRAYTTLCNFSKLAVAELELPHAQDVADDAISSARTHWQGARQLLSTLGKQAMGRLWLPIGQHSMFAKCSLSNQHLLRLLFEISLADCWEPAGPSRPSVAVTY